MTDYSHLKRKLAAERGQKKEMAPAQPDAGEGGLPRPRRAVEEEVAWSLRGQEAADHAGLDVELELTGDAAVASEERDAVPAAVLRALPARAAVVPCGLHVLPRS